MLCYTPNWKNKIYSVHRIQTTVPVTYLLKDRIVKFISNKNLINLVWVTRFSCINYYNVNAIACAYAGSALTLKADLI